MVQASPQSQNNIAAKSTLRQYGTNILELIRDAVFEPVPKVRIAPGLTAGPNLDVRMETFQTGLIEGSCSNRCGRIPFTVKSMQPVRGATVASASNQFLIMLALQL